MYFSALSTLLAISSLLSYLVAAAGSCTYAKKVAGIQHEIDTISSHSFDDANQIPLAPNASRTFFVTPNEAPNMVIEVNTGVTAETVRAELVGLATFLDASVPKNSLKYIKNKNGTVTSDFVQPNRFVLRYAHAREIHEFNDACQITKITGFVHSSLFCPKNPDTLGDPVLIKLCKQFEGKKREAGAV